MSFVVELVAYFFKELRSKVASISLFRFACAIHFPAFSLLFSKLESIGLTIFIELVNLVMCSISQLGI